MSDDFIFFSETTQDWLQQSAEACYVHITTKVTRCVIVCSQKQSEINQDFNNLTFKKLVITAGLFICIWFISLV